ncbi:MAG: hypothetical protein Q7U57_10660 [Methylovulum sp.]|nr:hypothetical protein [Methylovulum sp.]
MAAKIIRKEGKKLIIGLSIDLEDSMLDSEEPIQAVINEPGTLALKKHWSNSTPKVNRLRGVNHGEARDRKNSFTKHLRVKSSLRGMFITSTEAEEPSTLWSNLRVSQVGITRSAPASQKWLVKRL